jgi:hypothetical protein
MGNKRRSRNQKRGGSRRRGPVSGRRWSSVEVFEGPAGGPDVVSPGLDEVLAAMESVPKDLDWPALADQIVPVFQRVRPYHPSMPEPIRVVVPPGLSVSFGVDIGPAFLSVHAELLERWAVTPDELLSRGLHNLDRRMAEVTRDDLVNTSVDAIAVRALQSSSGSASTYVLRPASLGRILGTHPQLLIAPMRNLLLSMPVDADRELVAWLFDEFAAQDPNCLAPAAFILRDGGLELEPLGDPFGRA